MTTPLLTGELHPAPGARIVVDRLTGRPPAHVYLHGLGSVRNGVKSTALLRRAAARGLAAARFDFRGHGESSGRTGVVTLSELVADARAVLETTGPAVLVGSSLGGLVAAFLAAERPAEVPALALLSPAFGFLTRLAQILDPEGRLRTAPDRTLALHPRVLEDGRAFDEASLPSQLSMPVFVAHGERDEVVPPAFSERFVAAIPHPHKDLWLVPGGDHRLADPIERIYDRMQAFFDRTAPAAS